MKKLRRKNNRKECKWSNIKKNACPRCDTPFKDSGFSRENCIACDRCGLRITKDFYREVMSRRVEDLIIEEQKDYLAHVDLVSLKD